MSEISPTPSLPSWWGGGGGGGGGGAGTGRTYRNSATSNIKTRNKHTHDVNGAFREEGVL